MAGKNSTFSSSQREAFKAKALDGFSGNYEQIHQAEGLVLHMLEENGDGGIDLAVERLGEAKETQGWRRLFYWAVLFICIPLFLMGAFQKYLVWDGLHNSVVMSGVQESAFAKDIVKGLSVEELLLLKGNDLASNEAERWKALWDLDVSNPAYYMEYVRGYLSEYDALPSGFVEKGESLDPGNALYKMLAAAQLASESTQRSSTWSTGDPASEEFEITDELKYNEAKVFLYQALDMPRYHHYELEVLTERIAVFSNEGDDFVSRLAPFTFFRVETMFFPQFRSLAAIITIEAGALIGLNDVDEFDLLKNRWLKLSEMFNDDGFTLLDTGYTYVIFIDPMESLREAAFFYGLSDEVEGFDQLIAKRKKRQKNILGKVEAPKVGVMHSVFFYQSGPRSDDEPSIKAGRLTEHCFLGRVSMFSSALFLFLVILGIVFSRFRYGVVLKKLSFHMRDLLDGRGYGVIVFLGAALPLSYYFIINQWSPMSARELGIQYHGLLISGGQFFAFLLLSLSLPILLAKWRWASLFPVLGVKLSFLDFIAVFCSVVAMPLIGWRSNGDVPSEVVIYSALTLMGLNFLWLIGLVVAALWRSNLKSLGRLMIGHTVIPVYILMSLIMLIFVPIYHAEEKKWVAKDELLSRSVDEPGFTRYEYRVTQQVKRELAEVINSMKD